MNIVVSSAQISDMDGMSETTGYPANGTRYTFGKGVKPGQNMWVAVGGKKAESNTIAYSYDGIYWTGVTDSSSNIFVTYGRGVAWNGRMWVAVGGADSLIPLPIVMMGYIGQV